MNNIVRNHEFSSVYRKPKGRVRENFRLFGDYSDLFVPEQIDDNVFGKQDHEDLENKRWDIDDMDLKAMSMWQVISWGTNANHMENPNFFSTVPSDVQRKIILKGYDRLAFQQDNSTNPSTTIPSKEKKRREQWKNEYNVMKQSLPAAQEKQPDVDFSFDDFDVDFFDAVEEIVEKQIQDR